MGFSLGRARILGFYCGVRATKLGQSHDTTLSHDQMHPLQPILVCNILKEYGLAAQDPASTEGTLWNSNLWTVSKNVYWHALK